MRACAPCLAHGCFLCFLAARWACAARRARERVQGGGAGHMHGRGLSDGGCAAARGAGLAPACASRRGHSGRAPPSQAQLGRGAGELQARDGPVFPSPTVRTAAAGAGRPGGQCRSLGEQLHHAGLGGGAGQKAADTALALGPGPRRSSYQLPVLGMEAQGSAGARAGPSCSSSTEIWSGERTKAMRPSRGGRRMVTPWSARRWQAA